MSDASRCSRTQSRLLVFDTDIKAMRLALTQGISFTTGYYWHYDDETRAFARRFFERHKSMPTMTQAGVYSAALRYLKAVAKVGTLESDAVMAEMKKSKVNDFFGRGGYIRTDGRMVHDMYLVEVKTPSESKEPWDIAKVRQVIPGEEAVAPLEKSSRPFLEKR
jgi:branched-chain amino acid transport system substrate-binding protein